VTSPALNVLSDEYNKSFTRCAFSAIVLMSDPSDQLRLSFCYIWPIQSGFIRHPLASFNERTNSTGRQDIIAVYH
jgi:hypothetical protein